MTACSTCPVYPPGVLQTVTIPDPTSLDGFGDLEITLIPSREVTDINHFSEEGTSTFKEMLYEADEDYRNLLTRDMKQVSREIEALEEDEEDDEIMKALQEAEEDADYEEWINSKQYVKSLQEYNRHKLLAWNKEEEGEHPKWSGEYKEIARASNWSRADLLGSFIIKERYRVEVYVHTLNWGKGGSYYAFGSTPYGDVYIPQKITEYLKDFCGLYEMDIALQDVEGPPGKGPNSFRWTCVYLHNKGFALE
jgi:hypothetical protein